MLPAFDHQTAGPADGPWLTFVPGIGNDRHFWSYHARSLSDRFRVLSFDPWGHGDSPPPPEACGFADIVAGLVQLWDTLGVERSSLVGLGFGGSVSLATALDYPDRVGQIVACCCRARQPDDRRDFWRERSAKAAAIGMDRIADITVDRWLDEDFRKRHPDVDLQLRAMFKRTTLAGYQAYVRAFIEMDFTDRLAKLTLPTLLIAAEHDHGGGPVENMRAMAAAIPSARLEIIPGAGHIVNFEAPDMLLDLLNDFLTSRPH
jgi:3-oxoadipate enol-lactonase